MIKFIGKKDGKKVYGFGLSEENIELLKKGRPISISNPDFADFDVLIFYGETEESMAKDLKEIGALDERLDIKTFKYGQKRII